MNLRSLGLALLLPVLLLLSACLRRGPLPMTYYYGEPWTEASVNGRKGLYLIDTGASVSIIDSATADQLYIRREGLKEVAATTGMVTLERGWVETMRLGAVRHDDRLVSIQDLRAFRAPGGRKHAGLIGSDFLLPYTIAFDMEEARIDLSRQPGPLASGLRSEPMHLLGGIPAVEIRFPNHGFSRWGKIDTGSGYADERRVYLEMAEPLARRLLGPRLQTPPAETATVISLAGSRTLDIYDYGPVLLLGIEFPSVRIVVHKHGQGIFSTDRTVLISGSILNQFRRVEIDYPRRLVWLRDW